MKIFYSPYVLKKKKLLENDNEPYSPGVLLKVEWQDNVVGYSDLHPLKEFGDMDVVEQLESLRQGKINFLAEQSIWLARRDGEARKMKKSLLTDIEELKNNYLITNAKEITVPEIQSLSNLGFQIVKLKIGSDLPTETLLIQELVKAGLQLRLDANSKFNFLQFLKFMSGLSKLTRNRIQYIEDPFAYKVQQWQQGVSYSYLACDQEKTKVDWKEFEKLRIDQRPFSHLILKPAREEIEKNIQIAHEYKIKTTITSSKDHFVGALHALSLAASLKKQYGELIQEPGCLSFNLYEAEPFSRAVVTHGPQLNLNSTAKGYGIGFDQLFAELPWTALVETELP